MRPMRLAPRAIMPWLPGSHVGCALITLSHIRIVMSQLIYICPCQASSHRAASYFLYYMQYHKTRRPWLLAVDGALQPVVAMNHTCGHP